MSYVPVDSSFGRFLFSVLTAFEAKFETAPVIDGPQAWRAELEGTDVFFHYEGSLLRVFAVSTKTLRIRQFESLNDDALVGGLLEDIDKFFTENLTAP